eukprot:COSAG06_NODE_17886_length_915_cov_1422.175245_1_plen_176_part_01
MSPVSDGLAISSMRLCTRERIGCAFMHRKERGRILCLRRRRCSIQCYYSLLPAAAGYCYCPPPPPRLLTPLFSRSFLVCSHLLTFFSLSRPSPSCSWLSSAPAAAVCPSYTAACCRASSSPVSTTLLPFAPSTCFFPSPPLALLLLASLCACHVMSGLVCCRPWLLPCIGMRAQEG